MPNKIIFLIMSLLFSSSFLRAEAGDLPAEAIVRNANRVAYYQGRDGSSYVKMTIKDSRGRVRERELTMLRRDEPSASGKDADNFFGGQKFYVYFHKPADVNKMTYIVWKHPGTEDDRWLYLPALDVVKRLAGAEKRTSFAGSDFLYEDVSGRSLDDDRHELAETSASFYVLKNTPKKPETVEFSYYKTWIHRETFVMVKSEFYDKNNGKYREYSAEKVEKIQGYQTVTKMKAKNLKTGGETVAELSNVKYDLGLDAGIFTERYLRNPPQKYLK